MYATPSEDAQETEAATDTAPPASSHRIPPSRWPLWYFGFAHICLATAGGFVALQPQLFFGSVYHPQAMVPVHLVTLGWITSSILGALYLIAPMALRIRLRPSRLDGLAYVFHVLGVVGMVSHFWIYEYSGMAWSGLMVAIAVVVVAGRVLPELFRARVAAAVKLCIALAFANFLGAYLLGTLAGLGKLGVAVPGHQLTTVWSHAHLAALGWATMMVFGAALRLLPMLLPAAMPGGSSPVVAALVFEAGVLGVVAGLFFARPTVLATAALLTTAGIALFLRHLLWMLRHRKPPARGLTRPRLPLAHLAQCGVYLLAATVLGLSLAIFDPGPLLRSRLMPVYGVCGLLGFLAQMVVGVAARLWPLYAWQRAFVASGYRQPPEPPHDLVDLRLRWIVLIGWSGAVPLLLLGLATHTVAAVEAACLLLVAAVVIEAIDGYRMLVESNSSS